jgi:hypothetical protein
VMIDSTHLKAHRTAAGLYRDGYHLTAAAPWLGSGG